METRSKLIGSGGSNLAEGIVIQQPGGLLRLTAPVVASGTRASGAVASTATVAVVVWRKLYSRLFVELRSTALTVAVAGAPLPLAVEMDPDEAEGVGEGEPQDKGSEDDADDGDSR